MKNTLYSDSLECAALGCECIDTDMLWGIWRAFFLLKMILEADMGKPQKEWWSAISQESWLSIPVLQGSASGTTAPAPGIGHSSASDPAVSELPEPRLADHEWLPKGNTWWKISILTLPATSVKGISSSRPRWRNASTLVSVLARRKLHLLCSLKTELALVCIQILTFWANEYPESYVGINFLACLWDERPLLLVNSQVYDFFVVHIVKCCESHGTHYWFWYFRRQTISRFVTF